MENKKKLPDEELEGISGGSGPRCYFSYCVVRGDTLAKIASKYKTTVEMIMLCNALGEDTVRAGQMLLVPDAR